MAALLPICFYCRAFFVRTPSASRWGRRSQRLGIAEGHTHRLPVPSHLREQSFDERPVEAAAHNVSDAEGRTHRLPVPSHYVRETLLTSTSLAVLLGVLALRHFPGTRSRLGSSLRDSPTYEDFGDPLEARRRKRREERERAGASTDAAGNGAGHGRQYISSFEVSDSKVRVDGDDDNDDGDGDDDGGDDGDGYDNGDDGDDGDDGDGDDDGDDGDDGSDDDVIGCWAGGLSCQHTPALPFVGCGVLYRIACPKTMENGK